MTAWPFVIAAYGVTLAGGGMVALLSYLAMRKAER